MKGRIVTPLLTVLGLMSGTSLDGIDAALITTDGEGQVRSGPSLTLPYAPDFRERLRGVLGGVGPVAEIERELTLLHAEAAAALLAEASLRPAEIAAIGFHGHTILHRPDQGETWQIGDGALLAERLSIPVVNDFRSADVAAGGQGAPLVPVYHRALAAASAIEGPLAVLNIGGVANVTWIGPGGATADLVAFDTGPGNALIDDWAMRHLGRPLDEDGRLAAAGTVDQSALRAFAAHPYFGKTAPKSLDRNDFARFVVPLVAPLSPEDGAATLTAFTVAAVALAARRLPTPPRQWLVGGGGAHNPVLMQGLVRALGRPVREAEAVGWRGDALEAEAFAYLAARHLAGLPSTFAGTTGVARPVVAGRLWRPGA